MILPITPAAPLSAKTLPSVADKAFTLLAQNQVLNRVVIEALGYTSWNVFMSRNRYERFERLMDSFMWWGMALGLPILTTRWMLPKLGKRLAKQFPASVRRTTAISHTDFARHPMALPFEWLDPTLLHKRFNPKSGILRHRLKDYGLKQLPDALAKRLLAYKLLGVMSLDFAFMWLKVNCYQWGKNWVTEKLSGKKGFSGVLNFADQAYLNPQVKAYEAKRKKRLAASMLASFAGTFAFPLMLWGVVRSTARTGPIALLKKRLPFFNYTNAVFMSKNTMLWQVLWGYNLIGFLAARSKDERREHLTKAAAVDFLFFYGDDALAGLMAKYAQRKYKAQLGPVQLFHRRRGLFGQLQAKGLHELFAESARIADPQRKALVRRLAKTQLVGSLLGTSLALGVVLNVLTQWYTRQKVLKEQAQYKAPQALGAIPKGVG